MTTMLRQVLTVTMASLATSVLCTFAMMKLFFPTGEGLLLALSIAAVVPVMVAIPTTLYVYRQREKIRRLHCDLQVAHEELRGLHERAEYRASIDQMTGLLNRESFLTKTKFRRRKSDAGFLLMIDVDNFKQVNDKHGHQAGDTALLLIVSAMNKHIRRSDILGRLGGEEFALFLSDLHPERAWELAEDIRRSIERLAFEPRAGVVHPLTVSIGIAPAPAGERMYAIMDHADRSLYGAKHSGRNRVAFRDTQNEEPVEIVSPVALSKAS